MIFISALSSSLSNGRQSLGQNLAVTAVAAVDVVVDAQMKGLTDRRRLLPERQVCRAVVSIRNAPIGVAELDFIQHGLKGANDDHVALHPKQILGAVSVQFLPDGFAVLIHRYGGERDEAAFSQLHRIKHLGFGHYSSPVIPAAMSGDSQITRLSARNAYYSTPTCPYEFKRASPATQALFILNSYSPGRAGILVVLRLRHAGELRWQPE